MRNIYRSLLLILTAATQRELARHVAYLKADNNILRSRLSKRITATPAVRTRLLKVGKPLRRAIKDLTTIVSTQTFACLVSQEKQPPGKPVVQACGPDDRS
jgi:putative transposase